MANDNYPPGVYDMHPHFYPPDKPECPECYADLDWEWLFCPFCGRKIRPEEWDGDVYVGPQMYDSARDYDVDRALDRNWGFE